MLDIGADEAFAHFGIRLRTIGYCEKEAFAQDIIRARIAEGYLDDAPIWPDVQNLPASRYRGHVGAIVAGFPCQPFSVAGKGLGLKDERYLFADILRVADESGAYLLLLENVVGLLTPDDVDDGAGGTIRRSPAADVFRLLAAHGFDARWLDMGADDIGAPHGRRRWWCLCWRRDRGGGGTKLADSDLL